MKETPRLLLCLYLYGALQIAGWFCALSLNDNERWAHAFHRSVLVAFLPLNLLDWAQIELVWGTTNLFRAHYVFALFTDVVLMTLVSVHVLYFAIRFISHLARRPHTA